MNRLINDLINAGVADNRSLTQYYAEKILKYNKTGIDTNAKGIVPGGNNVQDVNENIKRYQDLLERSFLCCSFPTNRFGRKGHRQFTFNDEVDIRHFQFNNFLKFANANPDDNKMCVRRKVYWRYEDFLQSAKYFIEKS